MPLLDERFARRGAYFVPAGKFDWEALGVHSYVPRLAPSDDPDAWRAEDALFVPLRDPKGLLIGVISVDEPESGRRPTDDELDALVAIASHAALALRMAQDTAHDVEHQRMLEGILEVSAQVAEAEDPEDDPPGRLRRDPRRARLRDRRDRVGASPRPAARAARVERLVRGGAHQHRDDARRTRAAAHGRVRDRGVLPRAHRGGRRAPRRPGAGQEFGALRPRAERMVAALADRAAHRAAGSPARADLGGRAARPAAAHPRAPPGAAAVREPGGGGAPVRGPGAEAAPRGHPRPAHGAA